MNLKNAEPTDVSVIGKGMRQNRGGRRNDEILPRRTQTPTVADLHWAAGFIEGEGYIRRYDKRKTISLHISATNCDLEPLEKLRRLFGGRISKKVMGPRNRQQPYYWAAHGARAHGIILTLYCLFSNKRKGQCLDSLQMMAQQQDLAWGS